MEDDDSAAISVEEADAAVEQLRALGNVRYVGCWCSRVPTLLAERVPRHALVVARGLQSE
eukprot:365749-Chlamydomonas_euryale.AAC.8